MRWWPRKLTLEEIHSITEGEALEEMLRDRAYLGFVGAMGLACIGQAVKAVATGPSASTRS